MNHGPRIVVATRTFIGNSETEEVLGTPRKEKMMQKASLLPFEVTLPLLPSIE